MDPALIDDRPSLLVGSEIFEGLTRLDASLRPAPGLAESWEIADQGRTYTFHLRNARYQSGTAVQALDAVAAWTRALAPATASPLTTFFSALGLRYPGDRLSGVEALDPLTLRLRLPRPDSELLTLLALPPYWLYDPLAQDITVAGSGPYRLEQWVRGRSLRLHASEGYWGAPPRVQSVDIGIEPDSQTRIDRFSSGAADLVHGFSGPELLAFARDPQHAAELQRVPTTLSAWLGFNTIAGSRYDKRARTAIAQALDRSRLTDLALYGGMEGAPATDLLPLGVPGHLDRDLPAHDPAAARAALDQAGFPGTIDLYLPGGSTLGAIGRELQDQIQEATGRTVALHPSGDFFVRAALDQFPFYVDNWSADIPYPSDILETVLRSQGQFNNLHLQDAQVDAGLDQARAALTFEEAMRWYQQAEGRAISEVRVIPLYSGVETYLVRPGLKVPFTGGVIPYHFEDVR